MGSTTVNLDAMIGRADFASNDQKPAQSSERFEKIAIKDLVGDGAFLPKLLRKPDFQRETTQWKPSQVAMLIESFLDGELIPAVILWQSATHIFVIDGGHRLSALLAWAYDDYGDGVKSGAFFKNEISASTKRLANRTRSEVRNRTGSFQHYQQKISSNQDEFLDDPRLITFATRGLQVQWIVGDADKAETSFFKINTQGSALDPVEEKLLRNRGKAPAVAARSIARAATGHKYWSKFPEEKQEDILNKSKSIHKSLFAPEVASPIKTIDLPIGGTSSISQTLDLLISISEILNPKYKDLTLLDDDDDGSLTIVLLDEMDRVVSRLVGNRAKSLGLHPFVYFYTNKGRHYPPLMLAMVSIVAQKLRDNDRIWFKKFTERRGKFEELLLEHKGIITLLLSAMGSKSRVQGAVSVLELIFEVSERADTTVTPNDFAMVTGLESRLYTIQSKPGANFDDDAKSSAFLRQAFAQAIRCPICKGYLDPAKSVSYDHIVKKEHGGGGSSENCQLSHPYCNSGIKG